MVKLSEGIITTFCILLQYLYLNTISRSQKQFRAQTAEIRQICPKINIKGDFPAPSPLALPNVSNF